MLRDKESVVKTIKQGENYLASHPQVTKMTLDEIAEYFANTKHDRGINWVVMALVVAESLDTSNLEGLVTKLSTLEVAPLTKEYIGYLLYAKSSVNIENVLLLSDKMGVFDQILPYTVSNIVFQNEFQEENILNIAFLINSHLRENIATHNLLLNYAKHIKNFSKETAVFDILIDINFEFKNDILSKSNCDWFKKSKDDAVHHLEESFKSNREEKIKTALCIIKESYDPKMVECFYGNISRVGKSITGVRGIIVSIYATYILSSKKENETYIFILDELKTYSQDNQNKNDFLMAIQHKDKIIDEVSEIFEKIVSAPLPDNESFGMVDPMSQRRKRLLQT